MVKINKIKGLMAENGDNQERLADKLGMSVQNLNYKLTGKYEFSLKQLQRIATIYGVRTIDLIEG